MHPNIHAYNDFIMLTNAWTSVLTIHSSVLLKWIDLHMSPPDSVPGVVHGYVKDNQNYYIMIH